MSEVQLLDYFAVESVQEDEGVKTYHYFAAPFVSSSFNGVLPTSINVLPVPGKYSHKVYGTVTVSRESNQEFIDNFNNSVYQNLLPIDLEHKPLEYGAIGFMKPGTGRLDPQGAGWVDVEWNSRGQTILSEGRFAFFSPSWFRQWTDPANDKTYKNVLIGGAVTNQPFFKDKSLKPLFASELSNNPEAVVVKDMPENKTPSPESFTQEQFNDLMNRLTAVESERAKEKEAYDKTMQQMSERLTAANVEITKYNEAAQIRHFREIIKGTDQEGDGSPGFKGDASVHGAVMFALAEKYGEDSDEFRNYVAHERSLAEQLDASELLKHKGGSGASNPTNESSNFTEKFMELAAEKRAKFNLTMEESYNMVAREDPVLYRKYRSESARKVGDE